MKLYSSRHSSIPMTVICLLTGIFLAFFLLFTAVERYSLRESYFQKQFEKNNISAATGFNTEELHKIIRQMTGYLAGRETNFNLTLERNGKPYSVFNEREISHMIDVKVLFILMHRLKWMLLFLLILFWIPYFAYIFYLYRQQRSSKTVKLFLRFKLNLSKMLAFNGLFTLAAIGVLGFMLLSDFGKYFVHFHEIFFTNDLWLLNPETDHLIQMLPEVFFYDISTQIILQYAILSLGLGLLGFIFYILLKKEEAEF